MANPSTTPNEPGSRRNSQAKSGANRGQLSALRRSALSMARLLMMRRASLAFESINERQEQAESDRETAFNLMTRREIPIYGGFVEGELDGHRPFENWMFKPDSLWSHGMTYMTMPGDVVIIVLKVANPAQREGAADADASFVFAEGYVLRNTPVGHFVKYRISGEDVNNGEFAAQSGKMLTSSRDHVIWGRMFAWTRQRWFHVVQNDYANAQAGVDDVHNYGCNV
jgi:hypothetical protein